MHDRIYPRALLLMALALPFAGCTNPLIDTLAITPGSQSLTVAQTVQFTATGTVGHGDNHPSTTQDDTDLVTWTSSTPTVATINSTGMATAVGAGTTTITATMNGFTGTITASATLTVTASAVSTEPIVSVTITPGLQSLSQINQTAQFIALGTTGSGTTVNLTNQTAKVGTATINAAVWSSSVPAVGTISATTGVATSAGAGTTTITAIATNPDGTVVRGTATLTVTTTVTSSEPIVSLGIIPASQTLTATNQTAGFIVLGTTGSGTTVNLTNQTATVGASTIKAAVWASSVPSVASINPATGIATALTNGVTAITAVASNPDGTVVTATVPLTVNIVATPEPIVSLAIVPGSQIASVIGQTVQYVVIGTTSTGATVNLTNQSATVGSATISAAKWGSSSANIATINSSTGLATVPTGAVNGVTVITATATNPDGTAVTATSTLTVNITAASEPLVSLSIVPGSQTASVTGQTVQYIVIGTTSTGSTVNLTNQPATVGTSTIKAAVWGSSSSAIATINANTGLATAVGGGTVAITAIAYNPDGSAITGTATFTVSANPEPIVSLAIIPNTPGLTIAGQTQQFIAIGTTPSGATVNLTSNSATVGGVAISPVVWGSSVLSVATIGTTGVVGATAGLAVAGTSGSSAITAIAYNPDGTAVVGSAVLTVTSSIPEPIVSLTIVPTSQFGFSVTQTVQFIAIGTTSTGTTVNLTSQQVVVGSATIQPATWSSSNPGIATAGTGGIVEAVGVGSTAISAAVVNPDGTVVTGTASYTVKASGSSETLVSITVTPPAPAPLAGGGTTNLTATGKSGAGATVTNPTVAWVSSNPGVATVNGTGTVTAVGPGVTAITATATNPDLTTATGVSVVTVTSTAAFSGSIASIAVIPGSQAVATPTETAQFIAIGTTTTGATVDLTHSAQLVWSSSSAQIANIIVSGVNAGLATGSGQGTATITAEYTPPGGGNVVGGTATLTVSGGSAEEFTAVTIIPSSQAISASGQTTQFIALGTVGTTGLQLDVTDPSTLPPGTTIKWSSDVPTVAGVSSTGLATGQGPGTTTITAELTNPDNTVVSASATLTASLTAPPSPLLSLTIIPVSVSVGNLQDTAQFIAIGTFSTAPFIQDVTNSVNTTWISSWPDVFPVDNSGGGTGSTGTSGGIVTAYGSGNATIIAEYKDPTSGSIQTATATFNCPLVLPNPTGNPPTPGSCFQGSQAPALKATITIYNEGLNTTNWLVTAPSATNTPNVIHCGPGWTGGGGSVCAAPYPVGTTIVVTAPAQAGVSFGGWSSSCTPSDALGNPLPGPVFYTAAGPNYCVVPLSGTNPNVTIGAIFN